MTFVFLTLALILSVSLSDFSVLPSTHSTLTVESTSSHQLISELWL